MKYIKFYILGFVFLASSCSGDWLNTIPTGSASTTEVMGTTANIKQAINGICKIMTMQHQYFGQGFNGEGTMMLYYGEYLGQDFYFPYMAPGWASMMNGQINEQPSRLYTYYPWYYYYMIIGNANTILDNIDNATGDEAERQFLKASALTFRAFSYSRLLTVYSDSWEKSNNGSATGVVLRLEANMDDLPLSTMAECYTQIYKDLDDAIGLYKESGLNRSQVYGKSAVCFPDLNVAYAVYARAALNREDYATAKTNALLAQEGFPLMSVADYRGGFYAPTSEWIFGSFNDATETLYYYSWQVMMAYNGYYGDAGQGTAINRVFVDDLPSTDIRKNLFLHKDIFAEEGQLIDTLFNPTNTAFTNQVAYNKANAYAQSLTNGAAPTMRYPYGNLKIAAAGFPGIGCIPFIRTSEMVLIEAEASYFLGNEQDARNALIKLNVNTDRDPEYATTASGQELFEEIVTYRRIELWGEGHSWFDFKRWNRNIVRVSSGQDPETKEWYGGNFHAAVAGTWGTDPHFWKWAIPDKEIDYNSALKLP